MENKIHDEKELKELSTDELIALLPYGLNLRQIVTPQFSYWTTYKNQTLKENEKIVQRNGRDFVEVENEPHKYENKWLATIEMHSSSTISWNLSKGKTLCVVGDTMKEVLIKLYLELDHKALNEKIRHKVYIN